MKCLITLLCSLLLLTANAQNGQFQFAFVTDTHIGSPNGAAEEDLRRTVQDINSRTDIAFVVFTGDITEMGTNAELAIAKQILDSLRVPWYIIPGNHDTGWSESGGDAFKSVFGNDKFSFIYKGVYFIGCASGPYVRMSDGHVPRDAVNWLDKELEKIPAGSPLVFLNHYPVDESLDNWYEITDRLRRHNTQVILCGHGHANKAINFEDIPGVMSRSNLRAKAKEGGYTLVTYAADSLYFTERKPVSKTEKKWTAVAAGTRHYSLAGEFKRPVYTNDASAQQLKARWIKAADANIISSPAHSGNLLFAGNQLGRMQAYTIKSGKVRWSFQTNGAIFSTPAAASGKLVFGSADGKIYCLNARTGHLNWAFTTQAAVLGCPLISGDTVFIGGSDHHFRALSLHTGALIWDFDGLQGPVVSTPLRVDDKLVVGAWDRHLYALSAKTGQLSWKWNNGSSVRNYSPASCIPVAANGLIFIVAPDRYITAIDAATGQTAWRNNDGGLRESLGIAEDGQTIYGKSMQDTVVAYRTKRDKQSASWKMHAGYGYEHAPSMLVSRNQRIYFGTRNGVVYCIDPEIKEVKWTFKLDNSMVNTVVVYGKNKLLVTTMDGHIAVLEEKN